MGWENGREIKSKVELEPYFDLGFGMGQKPLPGS